MRKFLLVLVLCASTHLVAQAPEIDWMLQYGGTLGEFFRTVIPTQDGGYLFGGYSNSPVSGVKVDPVIGFNDDYWIIKSNSQGTIEWQKTIGGGRTWGLGDEVGEHLSCISEVSDGTGYYLCGFSDSGVVGMKTEPTYGGLDYWVVKVNLSGELLWQKTIGGSANDYLITGSATADGGCIVGGYSYSSNSGNKTGISRGNSDYWVIKLSASGNIEWQQTLGGSNLDELYAVIPSEDGYLLAGTSASPISGDKIVDTHGYGDYWFMKLDLSGSLLWQKDIGGIGGDLLRTAIKTTTGYMLGGYSESDISFDKSENSRGGLDYWIVSIDNAGNINWDKTFGGNNDDILYNMKATPDSGFILAGISSSNATGDKDSDVFDSSTDGWVIKTNSSGGLSWQLDIGGVDYDSFNQVIALADGSYLLGGMSTIGSAHTGNMNADNYGTYDYLLVKLKSENLNVNDNPYSDLSFFPNPTYEKVTIMFNNLIQKATLDIYNTMGQMVSRNEFAGVSEATVFLPKQTGVYFIKMDCDGQKWVKKVIKH